MKTLSAPSTPEELQKRRELWTKMMREKIFRGEEVAHATDGTLLVYKRDIEELWQDHLDYHPEDEEEKLPEDVFPRTCACAWGYAAFAAADILEIEEEDLHEFLKECADNGTFYEGQPSRHLLEYFGFEVVVDDDGEDFEVNRVAAALIQINDGGWVDSPSYPFTFNELVEFVEWLNGTTVEFDKEDDIMRTLKTRAWKTEQ